MAETASHIGFKSPTFENKQGPCFRPGAKRAFRRKKPVVALVDLFPELFFDFFLCFRLLDLGCQKIRNKVILKY